MENQEKTVLNRTLKEQHFKDAEVAIKGGEKTGSIENLELVKKLVKEYKGKTIQAPIEVIITSAIFFNAREVIGIIEAFKPVFHAKKEEELKEQADKGEATAKDAMTALMLAAIRKEESKED